MATDTSLAGLDSLELAGRTSPVSGLTGRSVKIWKALWPKVLAVALVLAIWQVVYLLKVKPHYIFPGPSTTLSDLWDQMHHKLLWQAIGTTLQRAVIGYAAALVIGSLVGLLVA